MRSVNKAELSRLVKEAIYSYPDGLCFAETDGKPILVNRTMNRLIYTLKGHTVINANNVWDELMRIKEHGGCVRIDSPKLRSSESKDETKIVFRFPPLDGNIWQYSKQILSSGSFTAIQLEATNLTELYRISEQLGENNKRLEMLRIRQKALLDDIVRINHDKELLATKMKIHDDFGRCLIASRRSLDSEQIEDKEFKRLITEWSETIRGMQNFEQHHSISAEPELLKVANLIGCKLSFTGEKPSKRKSLLLLYSAVREALTNAVRHGNATSLDVICSKSGGMCRIVLRNNGTVPESRPIESGGLKNLRQTLEQEGAALDYSLSEGFALIISIPEIDTEA